MEYLSTVLFCRKCGYSYCQLCLQVLRRSNVRCLCKNSFKAKFNTQLDHELLKTKYWAQNQSNLNKYVQITNLEASSYTHGSPYNFLSISNYNISDKKKNLYNRDCQELNKHLTKHKQKFHSSLALKNARLVNFHYAKRYKLRMKGEILCKYDAIFLGVLHLREIKFYDCLFNLDFSLSFCKSIRFNIKRIETFYIYSLFYYENCFKNDLKPCFIILNAIKFCTKIKCLSFEPEFYESESTLLFPKSFYNFLSTFYVLNTICFMNLIFDNDMNINSFKSLISLQTLELQNCCFENKILFYCILDNIPNLNELILMWNSIKCNSINTNLSKENIKFKKTLKFSPILRIRSRDNCIENSIFQDLIQFITLKMKCIQINFSDQQAFPNFINFLKYTNLQFLVICYLNEVDGFNLEEFSNYLKNSQFLICLKLKDINMCRSKYRSLLQALSDNKSIKVLSFEEINSSNFSFDLIPLILTNQYISTLILFKCKSKIDLYFIEALSKNKSLKYLNLSWNEINEEYASKLSNLNLKGINVEYCGISEESEELIYQKIPRKEFPSDLLSYKNF